MNWTVRDLSHPQELPSAESLLQTEQTISVPAGSSGIVFAWRSRRCLVVSQMDAKLPRFEQACEAMEQAGWPIVKRSSGGAAFPQGPGVLNLSVITEENADTAGNIEQGYRWFCSACQNGLSELGLASDTGSVPGSFCDGRYNLIVQGKKIAGTSQRWSRRDGRVRKLFHCGFLLNIDKVAVCDAVNTFYSQAGQPLTVPVVSSAASNLSELIIDYDPNKVLHALIESMTTPASLG
ncbi:MAG: biotin/lipoate A/B protein ligase family protein [Pseudomonadales bacterium]